MTNIKKLFAVSDVHGFFTEMKSALDRAGFEPDNPEHLLVFCGDMFDRGTENRAVFRYFSELKNKILIRGNHDERLFEILEAGQMETYDLDNDTDLTVREFFGDGCLDGYWRLKITDESLAEGLKALYRSECDYFAFGKYIFTHGWLPSKVIDGIPYLLENWRDVDAEEWKNARWLEWPQMYQHPDTALLPGKIIVCGHRPTKFGDGFDAARPYGDYSIFYGDGLIAIDGATATSGIVNVLVIDAEAEA